MPGIWITKRQVKLYMQVRNEGLIQLSASAKVGISERSGRNIERGIRAAPRGNRSGVRTRPDPFLAVWESELLPMLVDLPMLQPITLLEYLQEKHVDESGTPLYPDSLLRTLQRRIKTWKAIEGPKKEVIFRQTHLPGRLGLSDFTQLKKVTITVNGEPLEHLLYHFRLAYSGWSHIKVVLGGESYTALAEGLQEALWRLGGSPLEHRTDSLSAAFKNLTEEAKADFTQRYEQFCQHYRMEATRNNRGVSHENGSIESPHGHLKRRIQQALLLRGSHDFASLCAYQAFMDTVVHQHNRRNAKAMTVERDKLQPLPCDKTMDYIEVCTVVSGSSTIDVRRVTYTVPSQLQNEVLRTRLYHDRLECYLGSRAVCQLARVYPTGKMRRARQINYRHVIHSLVKKPQAFRYSQLREDLLPSPVYQKIWQVVNEGMEARSACKFIVGLLHLAATEDCEQALGEAVLQSIAQKRLLKLYDFQNQFKKRVTPPSVAIEHTSLESYAHWALRGQEVSYG
jgi:transposase InsO family protein